MDKAVFLNRLSCECIEQGLRLEDLGFSNLADPTISELFEAALRLSCSIDYLVGFPSFDE